jgi:uncharacterized SAM-binding protein YcdF (DUF218 family)
VAGKAMVKRFGFWKISGYLVLSIIILMAGWFIYLYTIMVQTWEHEKNTKADVVIVLGAAVWSGQPSPALRERLEAARYIFTQGKVDYIVTTGGLGTQPPAESVVMRDYLIKQGIPKDRILMEDQSTSTLENLANAKRIMVEQGWEDAIVVTHGYHLHRALDMASSAGIMAKGYSVETEVLYLPFHVGRELLALTYWEWIASYK